MCVHHWSHRRHYTCLSYTSTLQLMLLIDIFASRSPTLSDDGCVALGALLHFTIILQYVWILAMVCSMHSYNRHSLDLALTHNTVAQILFNINDCIHYMLLVISVLPQQAVALWVNFMGFTDGREPLIIYVIISWGISIIIVVATILIGRFAVPLSNTELYSHTGGDL